MTKTIAVRQTLRLVTAALLICAQPSYGKVQVAGIRSQHSARAALGPRQAARALLSDHQIRRVATGDARRTSFHDAAADVLRPTLQAVAAGPLAPSPLRVVSTANQLSAQALLGANKATLVRTSPAKLSLVGKNSQKKSVELSLNANGVSMVVAAPSFASTSAGLKLAGSSGQLAVTMTLVSGGPAHVAALKTTLAAARLTGQKCKSLAVTATAYLDFASCAAWSAYVTSLGGDTYTAGSCPGNIKRVVVAKKTLKVPFNARATVSGGDFHDFTSLDLKLSPPAARCGSLTVTSLTLTPEAGAPSITAARLLALKLITKTAAAPVNLHMPQPPPQVTTNSPPPPAPLPASPAREVVAVPLTSAPVVAPPDVAGPPPSSPPATVAGPAGAAVVLADFCSHGGVTMYTNKAAPAVYFQAGSKSASAVCAAAGLAPAAIADGTSAGTVSQTSVIAAAAACNAAPGAYYYSAPAYAGELSFCPFLQLTAAAGGSYSAAYMPATYACASTGQGALVVCA